MVSIQLGRVGQIAVYPAAKDHVREPEHVRTPSQRMVVDRVADQLKNPNFAFLRAVQVTVVAGKYIT